MSGMNGTITENGNKYEWWAGPASPDAKEDYCVHCRRGDWGVTQYVASEPKQTDAEATARKLVPFVDQLRAA